MEPCASCHKLMDPIGFALENFDADGKWRTKQGGEGGVPLDTSAVLWDGTKVNGPVELRQALLQYSPQFVRMITEKLMTFGLGRGVEYRGHAGDPVHRAGCGQGQRQVPVDPDGNHQERSISDANEGSRKSKWQ